jgi:hypothetical protein
MPGTTAITAAMLSVAVVVVTRDVTASAPASPRTGASSASASLPEGHVPSVPTTVPPRSIAAGEKVAGFVVADMPSDQREQLRRSRQHVGFTYLFSGEDQAKTFAESRGGQGDRTDACMVDGGDAGSPGNDAGSAEPHDWPTSYSSMLAFQFDTAPASAPSLRATHRSKQGPSGRADVHLVRAERFVAEEDGRASLEMADAWVDARTHGVRLIGRSVLPLSRVFIGPNGLEVYAAREARDGAALEVVLHAPDRPSEDAALADQLRTQLRNMSVLLPDRSGANTDCGHLRFALRASAGVGQMATLQSVAFLPPLDGEDATATESESDDARGSRELQAMRQRAFQLTVSATATTTDEGPVMSIALGWSGRERSGV